MLHLIVLATVMSACLADDKAQPEAAAYSIHSDYRRMEDQRLHQGLERLRHDLNIPANPHRHLDDQYQRNWDHQDKGEKQFWTSKDRIVHEDDDKDTRPIILRNIKSHDDDHHSPDVSRQNEIIRSVYSPDYAEPTWTIDYRYLKTGGRDYTRGPGGQILILPKGIRTNEHKEYKNYDELIEHLRQRNLKERAKPQYFMPLGQEIQEKHEHSWYH